MALAAVLLAFGINWAYQVLRKPTELLFPLSGAWRKTPEETWASYAPIFRKYSTRTITPTLLAAIAQAEGSGNPLARTYWRWGWSAQPFEIYRPASSSVGMYQMTDGTFDQAKRLCVREHVAVKDDAIGGGLTCGFDNWYFRVLPSHAVELASAYLDRSVADALARNRTVAVSARQRRHLAEVIHLCGAGAGNEYTRNGFVFAAGERCAERDPRAYMARVDALEAQFRRMAAHDRTESTNRVDL